VPTETVVDSYRRTLVGLKQLELTGLILVVDERGYRRTLVGLKQLERVDPL